MNILQTIKLVWNNLRQNKLRAFLTMLGIIIGVGSVIILISLIQSYIDEQMNAFSKMGLNNVAVTISKNAPPKVSAEDMYKFADEHKDVFNGVAQQNGILTDGSLNIKTDKQTKDVDFVNALGVDENYVPVMNQDIKEGRNISYSDIASRNHVCVIGEYIANSVFKTPLKVGDEIYVKGIKFKIVGILDTISKQNQQWGFDNSVYVPISVTSMLNVSADDEGGGFYMSTGMIDNSASSYQFVAKDSEKVGEGTRLLREYLDDTFHNKKMYNIQDLTSMLGQVQQMRAMASAIAGGIGSISLLVAGIGIMNIMLVSVTERTREIGIRKSLGAKRADIRRQFIMEAGITGGIGGVIGIAIGIIGTTLLGMMMNIHATASMGTVILSFGVSVGIGMLFGFLPANKAAKLNPIDALRSE